MKKDFLLTMAVALLLVGAMALSISHLAREARAQVTTNRQITVLTGQVYTSTVTSTDIINVGENLNVTGGYVVVNVTGASSTPVITPAIRAKDPASGQYINLLVASTGITTTGSYVYLVYPGAGSAGAGVTQVAGYVLPPVWDVHITHHDADPITYSISALLVD